MAEGHQVDQASWPPQVEGGRWRWGWDLKKILDLPGSQRRGASTLINARYVDRAAMMQVPAQSVRIVGLPDGTIQSGAVFAHSCQGQVRDEWILY